MASACSACGRLFRVTSAAGAPAGGTVIGSDSSVDAVPSVATGSPACASTLCPKCLRATVAALAAELDVLQIQAVELDKCLSELQSEATLDCAVEPADGVDALAADVGRLQQEIDVCRSNKLRASRASADLTLAPRWWREHSMRMWRWAKAAEVAESCRMRTRRHRDVLSKLQNLTVCNDVLFIWSEAQFGTVNGLRLGTHPVQAVDWGELNAALGYVALLLATIANWTGCQFAEHRIVPQGSFSKISKVGDERKTHELYMTSRMFSTSRFNTSIKCLLSCLKELSDFATGNDPSLQLPYKITEVKVADITVDLDKPLQWTRAMKFMLTNLKWLLSWACKWRRGPAGLA